MSRGRRTVTALAAALVLSCAAVLVAAPVSHAAFGVETVAAGATNEDGSLDFQAGSHPYEYSVRFAMNLNGAHEPEGTLRSVVANLPPGLVGNPLGIPRCPREKFEGTSPRCPGNTQVGVARVQINRLTQSVDPVYNLVPPPGSPASFGFSVNQLNSLQDAFVRTGGDYGVGLSDTTIPDLEIQSIEESIWGVPAAASHDPERACINSEGGLEHGCSSGVSPTPFLTLPTSCLGPMTTSVGVESLEQPGVLLPAVGALSRDAGGNPAGQVGCGRVPFEPGATVTPERSASDSPTGLAVHIHNPQPESAEGLAEADLKDAVVDLPEGLVVDPSAADGLAACSEAAIALASPTPAECPEASKIGSVQIQTPLLEDPLTGAVYLARQGENPFHSLLALYIAVYDPISGVVVKLPGKVEADPVTGRLTATFDENPQLPFEDLSVEFSGGPRATLTTPQTCGSYVTSTDLTPWTSPAGADAHLSSSFSISSGANGAGCATSEAQLPNAPRFEAGTTTPLGGTYSPFVLKIVREDGSQRLQAINAVLPPGLTGRLAGIPYCSDAQIAAAEARRNPSEGALEQASPSCPKASEVGTVTVGAGSGSPVYVGGHAYLAGPYKGAPISLVIITPAVAGPFDLGTVVVRSALYVNPETTQITVKSDPIPTILQGIPLDVRSIAVEMNRSQFTLNPTSCEAMSVMGEAISTLGNVASLKNHFQVGGCNGLEFKPQLKIQLKGQTRRVGHPGLKAVVTAKSGEANIARAQVNLPHGEFLDQGNLNKTCTKPVLMAGNCQATSVYGKAKAWTPLLEKPLEGPVFLVGGYGYKLPALVAELNGQIKVLLVGKVDSGKNKGIRNTFEVVPDAPVSRFVLELKGGKKYGLLENSENLCKASKEKRQAIARFTGQNGKVDQFKPVVANQCGKQTTAAHKHKRTKK